jgi:ferritin
MQFSIEGRIRNMRLPDGQTALLYSIYEAVMNGIQAIEERHPGVSPSRHGRIVVRVATDAQKAVESITVRDNGVGLNPRHLDSFNICDTLEKASIGGRGVGRLVWLKAFGKVVVSSGYLREEGQVESLSFEFKPELEDSRANLTRVAADDGDIGTTISLSEIRQVDAKLSITLLARSLCHHFFPFFIGGSMPETLVQVGKRVVDVGQYLASRMTVEDSQEVDVPEPVGKIKITHVYVDPKIARQLSNSILLTAQGRVVESIEIEKKFALKDLDNKKAYACVVSGSFLDDKVDQERTSFKARDEDLQAIKDAALDAAADFLGSHITKIRKEQKKLVVDLLEEHPQLAVSVEGVDKYVAGLSPSMSDEDIAKTLFTLLYRHEKRVKKQIAEITDAESASQQTDDAVAALMQKVNQDAQRRLAEYTLKRHQVIQIARSMLKYVDPENQKYELEKAIHEFICPMGRMLSSKNYSDHNLWLIDDLLSYYQFFASDKALSALGIEGERKEPDLLFFNPFGFRREGTNDPVVIIEFKRPGDEYMTSDPVDQVLGYIEKLRDRTVRDADGAVVSDISDRTPFECIVVADLTKGAVSKLMRGIAQHPTPDGLGYYGFSQAHNASVRVISYRKLFRDAELRNRSFFEHLGLLPEEVSKAISKSMVDASSELNTQAVASS